MSELECWEVLSDRYFAEARAARERGNLREAWRCISASLYSAKRADEIRAAS